MCEEKLCRIRIKIRVQQFSCSGDVDFAVFDAEVVSVYQQRRHCEARNPKSREAPALRFAYVFSCPVIQSDLFRDFILERTTLLAGRRERDQSSIEPWGKGV